MALPTNITARVVPTFPSSVTGQTGIDVTKQNGAYLIGLDLDDFGAAQGSILYRSATAYTSLPPGTSGQVLTSGGAAGNPSWTSSSVADGSITTAKLADGAATFAKIQDITTDRLLGRDTTSSGDVEEISLSGGLEFDGSQGLRRSALTGDVTATAGSNATAIADEAVTFAKMQHMTTARVLGRTTAGTGDVEELTTSSVLDILGTTRGSVLYRGASGWSLLSPGTGGHVLTSNGAGADPTYQAAAGGGGTWAVAVFTSSDAAWSVPGGTSEMIIEAWGAGGGGGGGNASQRSPGGGGGGFCRKLYTGTMDSTLAVTIGASGSGGAASSAGSNGGNTTVVGTNLGTLTASGGAGATSSASPAAGGGGGGASGGDLNVTGQDGFTSVATLATSGVFPGGGAALGGAGGTSNVGAPGGSPGGGGSGGNHASPSAGGNGAAGLVIILTR